MNLKNSLIAALVFLVSIGATYGITKKFFPRTEVVEQTKEIDESVWVQRSNYLSERDMRKRLEERNKKLSETVESQNNEIKELIEIKGELQTKLDSTQSQVDTVHTTSRDTTLTFSKTYGDSLFKVTSKVGLKQSLVTNELGLIQLRPIRIDGVLTSRTNPELILQSPDFSDLEVNSFTVRKQPRFTRSELFLGGTLIGASATLLTIILLR
jgi:hypothetical protein